MGLPVGRWVIREPGAESPQQVLVVQQLDAPGHRRAKKLKGEPLPSELPLTRVTVIDAESAGSAELTPDLAFGLVGRAMTANRIARVSADDPGHPPEPLATRTGIGTGQQVADGVWMEAVELPASSARKGRRKASSTDERFAALLSGRESVPACALLVIRARADLDCGRNREAALMVNSALSAALVELGNELPEERLSQLADLQDPLSEAAALAQGGEVDAGQLESVANALKLLEAGLRSLSIS